MYSKTIVHIFVLAGQTLCLSFLNKYLPGECTCATPLLSTDTYSEAINKVSVLLSAGLNLHVYLSVCINEEKLDFNIDNSGLK